MNLNKLGAFHKDSDHINAIIETPKGSRNKYKYDEKHKLFKLHGVMPVGATFPFDFGFIPATRGDDGDPADVLLLMDQGGFTGCLVEARLIGVIEAEQTEKDGTKNKNDRLVAAAIKSTVHGEVRNLKDMDEKFLEELAWFFKSYNEIKGKTFEVLGYHGPDKAIKLVKEAEKRFKKENKH